MADVVEAEFAAAETEDAPGAALEAAVLFEAGWERLVDQVWVVTTPHDKSIERIGRRDGLDPDQVRARMAAQMSAEEKSARADRVIANDGTLEDLEAVVIDIWNEVVGAGS